MKIHFSPYFDGECYIDYNLNPSIIGEKTIGPKGLLDLLELHSGLGVTTLSVVERQARYYNAVRKYIGESPKNPFSDSFAVDEFGVARELLRWRDELRLSGWDSGMTGISPKLDALAAIENIFMPASMPSSQSAQLLGYGDRWQRVLDESKLSGILPAGSEIILYSARENLHPTYQEVLNQLENHETNVREERIMSPLAKEGTALYQVQDMLLHPEADVPKTKHNKISVPKDETLRLFHFHDYFDTLEYFASPVITNDPTVYINRNNKPFDEFQSCFGHPVSGSMVSNSNPKTIQLFKLVLSLLLKPINVGNLISFLEIRGKNILMGDILKKGGIDAEIAATLKEITVAYENNSTEKEVDRDEALAAVKELADWANKTKQAIDRKEDASEAEILRSSQLGHIHSICSSMKDILECEAEKIPAGKIETWIKSFYVPISQKIYTARKGSRMVIPTPGALRDKAEEIIWLDCQNINPTASMYTFLSPAEKESLAGKEVRIWNDADQIQEQTAEYFQPLLKCTNKVALAYSDFAAGESNTVHPIIVRIKAQFEGFDDFDFLIPANSVEVKANVLPSPRISYPIPNGYWDIIKPRDEPESYSSISLLLQSPMDYFLKYIMKLYDPGLRDMSSLDRTIGTVAHHYIETIVADAGKDINKVITLHQDEFDKRMNTSAMETGIILFMPENKIKFAQDKLTLKKTLSSLFDMIKASNYTIEGTEITYNCQLTKEVKLEGKIDLLLKDDSGNYIIFDLKWSKLSAYEEKVMNDRALQLAIYHHLLEENGMKVSKACYYMLRDGEEIEGKNLTKIYTQARNGYIYRWDQLTNDHILEDAEGMPTADIQYCNDTEAQGLFPLECEGPKGNPVKVISKYSDYTTFKELE